MSYNIRHKNLMFLIPLLMNLEDLILAVIKDTGLSRKEIRKMIDNKKSKKKNSISDKRALFILAKNLCVDI